MLALALALALVLVLVLVLALALALVLELELVWVLVGRHHRVRRGWAARWRMRGVACTWNLCRGA